MMATTQRPCVAIETHGCKLNQADSEVLARQFSDAGYKIVEPGEKAEVYVLNTCTVTHVADRKARRALRSARRRNPNAIVVATGCYAQRAAGELEAIPEVDLVLGNSKKDVLVQEVGRLLGEGVSPCATGAEASASYRRHTRAMVKIQEGCDQVCAYCIVPKVRGRERSISPDILIKQIQQRCEEGYQEVVLTGTQLGSYGFDLEGVNLGILLERVLAQSTIPRIRVSSLQPLELTPALISLWREPRLCPHFHMPLQSGSDAVLKRMRRRYTSVQYREAVELIRGHMPDAAITADVLVGFPGETQEEFQETYRFCRQMSLAALHMFPYSVRPGTSAAHYLPPVGEGEKRHRVQALMALGEQQERDYRSRYLGTVRPVLWERRANGKGSPWAGLTDNYLRVHSRSKLPLHNRIILTRLTREERGILWGEVLL